MPLTVREKKRFGVPDASGESVPTQTSQFLDRAPLPVDNRTTSLPGHLPARSCPPDSPPAWRLAPPPAVPGTSPLRAHAHELLLTRSEGVLPREAAFQPRGELVGCFLRRSSPL